MADDKPGRFTPKGSKGGSDTAKGKAAERATHANDARFATGRYTPPQEKAAVTLEQTKPWVPYVMFALLILGLLLIILNYVDLLPSSPSNWYLLGGLVAITLGFMTATQLK